MPWFQVHLPLAPGHNIAPRVKAAVSKSSLCTKPSTPMPDAKQALLHSQCILLRVQMMLVWGGTSSKIQPEQASFQEGKDSHAKSFLTGDMFLLRNLELTGLPGFFQLYR
jgi:hypothetical protein